MPTALRRLALALLPCAALCAATQEGPAYADLRVQGGVSGTWGQQLAVGLVCGDLSVGERGGPWAGLVLGARGVLVNNWRSTPADDSDKIHLKAAGIQGLAGIGLTLGRRDHLELLALLGVGVCGDHVRSSEATVVGHYRQTGGEFGWYHLIGREWQIGATAGWSQVDTRFDNGPLAGNAKSSGIDAAVVLGWRL